MNEVMEYLKACGTFYIATSEDGTATTYSFTSEPKEIEF